MVKMAESKTAQQVRDEHLRTLGPTLGPLYYALYNEVTWLHAKWNQYRILFAESPERVELLNRVAGFFFRTIQTVLWEDVLMHIARLTDQPKSKGKDNLTLLRLSAAVEVPELSVEIESLVEQAKKAAGFARNWRNRRLAHTDLSLHWSVESSRYPESAAIASTNFGCYRCGSE
jgi:AbiU2